MKLQTVNSEKSYASKKCTICQKRALLGQEVLVQTVPNHGYAFAHVVCAAPLFEQSNENLNKKHSQIREKHMKEKA